MSASSTIRKVPGPKKRYSFWKVFWVVLAFYLFFMTIGMAFASFAPTEKGFDLSRVLTWKNLFSQLLNLFGSVVFYYFVTNHFYRLFAEKKPALRFLRYAVIALLIL